MTHPGNYTSRVSKKLRACHTHWGIMCPIRGCNQLIKFSFEFGSNTVVTSHKGARKKFHGTQIHNAMAEALGLLKIKEREALQANASASLDGDQARCQFDAHGEWSLVTASGDVIGQGRAEGTKKMTSVASLDKQQRQAVICSKCDASFENVEKDAAGSNPTNRLLLHMHQRHLFDGRERMVGGIKVGKTKADHTAFWKGKRACESCKESPTRWKGSADAMKKVAVATITAAATTITKDSVVEQLGVKVADQHECAQHPLRSAPIDPTSATLDGQAQADRKRLCGDVSCDTGPSPSKRTKVQIDTSDGTGAETNTVNMINAPPMENLVFTTALPPQNDANGRCGHIQIKGMQLGTCAVPLGGETLGASAPCHPVCHGRTSTGDMQVSKTIEVDQKGKTAQIAGFEDHIFNNCTHLL